ncbi:MAG TPA: hypothetical protein VNT75_08315, partial [Symbiobacteriaceae bacterium]|nr:hypothetical protein [Symbiobacteriaceae bacterium]
MRGCRFLAALTMVLLLVGCVRKPPAAAPLALTVEPAGGAPGSEVMLTVKASGEVQLPLSSPENGHWLAHLCWGECRPADWQIVSFAPVAGAPGQLTAKVRVPVHQAGRLFPNGALKLTVACQTKGCDGVPSASAEFQVASDVKQVAWATLPAAPAAPVPNLSGAAHSAVDPTNPARRVVCETGSVSLNDPMGPPSLQVTADGGKTWRSISLQGVKLGQHGGMAGCRAVALDPQAHESFYLAGGGHMAAYDWDRDPAPLYTTDGGQSWTQVPAPAGADQPEAFIGYTMAPDGVTAWFARQEDQLIRGSHTADGGKTWQEVPL